VIDIDTAALRDEWGDIDEVAERAIDARDTIRGLTLEVDRLRATLARVEAQGRADAFVAARTWIERTHRPGLTSRATVIADLDEWADRAQRGVHPSGRPWPSAALTPDTKENDRG
jgi:hypothetical protein